MAKSASIDIFSLKRFSIDYIKNKQTNGKINTRKFPFLFSIIYRRRRRMTRKIFRILFVFILSLIAFRSFFDHIQNKMAAGVLAPLFASILSRPEVVQRKIASLVGVSSKLYKYFSKFISKTIGN